MQGLPEIPANDALRDILRHSEKKQDSTASSYSNGEIESIISSVLVSAAVAAGSLVFDTTVSTSVKDTDAGGRFVDEDPTDVISLYVAMERSLQQQVLF